MLFRSNSWSLEHDALNVSVPQYDLRVVFVHDGLYGRKHLYSYVHDKSCWWKIADSLIEKVMEALVGVKHLP